MTKVLPGDDSADLWIGRGMRRREDFRLITGAGRYTGDLLPEGCLHLQFIRSNSPGLLRRMNLDAVRSADGIVAVFTAADVVTAGSSSINLLIPGIVPCPMQIMAGRRVAATGQILAAIVATSLDAARDAGVLAEAEIDGFGEDEPGEDPQVLSQTWTAGDAVTAFRAGAHIVAVSVQHPLVAPSFLEPRAAVATWHDGRLTAWLSTQTPHRARDDLARMLDLPAGQVRVVAPDVGGAFGGKASIYPEDVVVAFAARRLGRPVKWCATRSEDLLAATQGRGTHSEGEIAVSTSGQILGLRARLRFQQGYWMPYSAVVPARNAGRILPGPYRLDVADIIVTGHQTNRAAVGIYRGAGRPEATMLMERLMDEAARKLGLDPIAFRERNIIASSAFPHATLTGETLDSGDYGRLLSQLREQAGYEALVANRARRRRAGEIVGLGVALYIEPCGQGWESASVSLRHDGMIVAATGSSSQGQGRETAFAQIVADCLGLDPDSILVRHGDTAEIQTGIGALASRSTAIGGSAMMRACEALREKALPYAARYLQCDATQARIAGSDRCPAKAGQKTITWAALARQIMDENPDWPTDAVLSASLVYEAEGESWSSGACLACVTIDAASGEATIQKLVWVDDAGRVVNPLLLRGQLVGGMAQGFGEALMEEIIYDESGQLLTGSLMDYALPRAADVPRVEIGKIETRAPWNALGAKGAGEAGCIGVPAAIVNAICDALAAFRSDEAGPHHTRLPMTSERIWRALQQGRNNRSELIS